MDILSLCRRMVMLFFCMACGFCAAKGGVMDTQSNKKLSALVVNVANPMQILASALTGERLLSTAQTLRLAGLIALIYLALIALSFPAVRLLRVRDAERGLYRFMFIFSNTGFLGYPVVESLLGSGAAFYVTIFVLFFQLFCWSYGASLMRGAARFRFQWKVLRQPCVAASLAAFAVYLSGWQPPALLHQTVKYVGDITSPVVMLIVGCSLAQMRFKQIFGSWRIYALSALKLAAVPLLAYTVLRHVLTNEFALCVLTVLLCMPIATNTTILSYQYGADETAASSGVFVSTLLSLLTIPLMMKLLFGT
ncbi:MAG: AEC family transporter [Oscillospiraceae bacterium]